MHRRHEARPTTHKSQHFNRQRAVEGEAPVAAARAYPTGQPFCGVALLQIAGVEVDDAVRLQRDRYRRRAVAGVVNGPHLHRALRVGVVDDARKALLQAVGRRLEQRNVVRFSEPRNYGEHTAQGQEPRWQDLHPGPPPYLNSWCLGRPPSNAAAPARGAVRIGVSGVVRSQPGRPAQGEFVTPYARAGLRVSAGRGGVCVCVCVARSVPTLAQSAWDGRIGRSRVGLASPSNRTLIGQNGNVKSNFGRSCCGMS